MARTMRFLYITSYQAQGAGVLSGCIPCGKNSHVNRSPLFYTVLIFVHATIWFMFHCIFKEIVFISTHLYLLCLQFSLQPSRGREEGVSNAWFRTLNWGMLFLNHDTLSFKIYRNSQVPLQISGLEHYASFKSFTYSAFNTNISLVLCSIFDITSLELLFIYLAFNSPAVVILYPRCFKNGMSL